MSVEFNDPIDLNKLEIQNVRLQQLSNDPTSPVEGQIWHRNDLHRPRVNDGTVNQELAYVSDALTEATATKDPSGFEANDTFTVTYNGTNRTVTITTTNPQIYYWYRGVRKTLGTNTWTSSAHTNTAGNWYLYSTDGINFTWSNTIWEFDKVMVVGVRYASSTKYIPLKETHGLMPWETHRTAHLGIGTQRSNTTPTGGTINGFVLTSTATADRRPGATVVDLLDEDILTSTAALVDGGPYSHLYLASLTTTDYTLNTEVEIVHMSGTNAQYQSPTTGVWSNMTVGRFANVYLIALPTTSETIGQYGRWLWFQPQAQYNSLALAQGEQFVSLNRADLINAFAEFLPVARVTIKAAATNFSIEAIEQIYGTRAGAAGVPAAVATTASSVAFTPVGGIAATDVQSALLELDTEKANLASPSFTGTVSGITKTMVGLGNVDNTSDANKPVSTATQTALNGKSDTSHTHTSFGALTLSGNVTPTPTRTQNLGSQTNKWASVSVDNVSADWGYFTNRVDATELSASTGVWSTGFRTAGDVDLAGNIGLDFARFNNGYVKNIFTDKITFDDAILQTYTGSPDYFAIYPGALIPSATNPSFTTKRDGAVTTINSLGSTELQVIGVPIFYVTSAGPQAPLATSASTGIKIGGATGPVMWGEATKWRLKPNRASSSELEVYGDSGEIAFEPRIAGGTTPVRLKLAGSVIDFWAGTTTAKRFGITSAAIESIVQHKFTKTRSALGDAISIEAAEPSMALVDTDATANAKRFRISSQGGITYFGARNDTDTAGTDWMRLYRTSATPSYVEIQTSAVFLGDNEYKKGNPVNRFNNTAGGTDGKIWDILNSVNGLDIACKNDEGSGTNNALRFNRTGNIPTSANFYTPIEAYAYVVKRQTLTPVTAAVSVNLSAGQDLLVNLTSTTNDATLTLSNPVVGATTQISSIGHATLARVINLSIAGVNFWYSGVLNGTGSYALTSTTSGARNFWWLYWQDATNCHVRYY